MGQRITDKNQFQWISDAHALTRSSCVKAIYFISDHPEDNLHLNIYSKKKTYHP